MGRAPAAPTAPEASDLEVAEPPAQSSLERALAGAVASDVSLRLRAVEDAIQDLRRKHQQTRAQVAALSAAHEEALQDVAQSANERKASLEAVFRHLGALM